MWKRSIILFRNNKSKDSFSISIYNFHKKFIHNSSLYPYLNHKEDQNVLMNPKKIKDKKLHVAIVGSGPSGCYTAKYLLSHFDKQQQQQQAKQEQHDKQPLQEEPSNTPSIDITVFERLPTPFGLIRSGIAPDHPEVKNVQYEFTSLFTRYTHPSKAGHEQQHEDDSIIGNKSKIDTSSSSSSSSAAALAATSSLAFRGNVSVGDPRVVTWKELSSLFHIVIFAYGCADSDVTLPVLPLSQQQQQQHDGESIKKNLDTTTMTNDPKLKGIFSAREFVAWYNGHPYYATSPMTKQLETCLVSPSTTTNTCTHSSKNQKRIIIIGNGNVALDCARILAKGSSSCSNYNHQSKEDENQDYTKKSNALWNTDITSPALNLLSNTCISSIQIIGRRGHVQGAFTIKELRELITLQKEEKEGSKDGLQFKVYSEELDLGMTPSSIQELEISKPKMRIDTLLRQHAISMKQSQQQQQDDEESTTRTTMELRFLFNPIQFIPHPTDPTRIGSIRCQRTLLQGPVGKQVAIGQEEYRNLPADLVLVSIGYKGLPLMDMDESMFDKKRGILKNVKGRILSTGGGGREKEDDNTCPQEALMYAVGWIKRGPTGIIGTNIPDAKETVQSILEDIDQNQTQIYNRCVSGRKGLDELLQQRSIQYVDFQDYLFIDEKERDPSRLRSTLQPREKITSIEEMLSIVSKQEEGNVS